MLYDARMVASISTIAFEGLNVRPVNVQVLLSSGLPTFTIVGLPDKAVAESRERVRGALLSLGLALPAKKITVNLSPADLQKEGSHFDLAIALGLLTAMDVLPAEKMHDYIALGELSLDGQVLAINGILPAALYAMENNKIIICPKACGQEAAWLADDNPIIAPDTLYQLISHIKQQHIIVRPQNDDKVNDADTPLIADFRDVKGQEQAKRALEVTASGGHHLLMVGPPGSGKSMLAQRLPGILPPLSGREALDVAIIHSISGLTNKNGINKIRPFRSPHHTASVAALAGGGSRAKPGEISLAHNGILFMDEFPEFPRQALEALRQPIESGEAMIARVNAHLTYPARFQLVAAMNPCRCGYLGDESRECKQAPECGFKYQSKISGPIFDRIDIHISVPEIPAIDLTLPTPAETSADIAKRVKKTRDIQLDRFKKFNSLLLCNAHMEGELLEKIAPLDDVEKSFLIEASNKLRLSARGFHRVLKVARTLADMAEHNKISKIHLAEALNYRHVNFRG